MSRPAHVHAICSDCYDKFNPDPDQYPDCDVAAVQDYCCWCNAPTSSGITVQMPAAMVACEGKHDAA